MAIEKGGINDEHNARSPLGAGDGTVAHVDRRHGLAGLATGSTRSCPAYVVAAWLAGIVINLFTYGEWWDIGVRDLGLMLGALTLARLAAYYDPPLFGRRRT